MLCNKAIWAAVALCLAACGEQGRLIISLERPQVEAFDPMQDVRLTRFGLRVIDGVHQSDQESPRSEDPELRLGQVPVGRPFDLRLVGKSATGQMLGLGLVVGLELDGEGDVPVAVKFRKPIGFVAGEHGLEQLDTTASKASAIHLRPAIELPGTSRVAASADGAWVLVTRGKTLQVLRTLDRRRWAEVDLAAPATCLAVSPDNRFAAACHADGRISVVAMDALAEGRPAVRLVSTAGRPSRVVFGRRQEPARVLVDGLAPGGDCSVHSSVVRLDLDAAQVLSREEVPAAAADLAPDPRDGRTLLTLPCEGRLVRINDGVLEDTRVPLGAGARDLAVTEQYIVLFSTRSVSVGNQDVPLGEAVLVDLHKQGFTYQTKQFDLPSLEVWSARPGDRGALGWLLDKGAFRFDDLVVAPDSQRAIALFHASYSADNSFGGCPFRVQMGVAGFMLVDLTVDAVIYWHMAQATIDDCATCDFPAVDQCSDWIRGVLQAGDILASPSYSPSAAVMLFGGD